jgi:hypothetical protein
MSLNKLEELEFSNKWKTTPFFWHMEDDLNILVYGRQPQLFVYGRQLQIKNKTKKQ